MIIVSILDNLRISSLYVDDTLIVCKSQMEIDRLMIQLNREFEMKDLSETR